MCSFQAFALDERLLQGVQAYGLERPLPVQQQAVGPLAEGRDVLIQAPPGTGRTLATLLGALARIDLALCSTQVLVLSPTRELAMQAFPSLASGKGSVCG